LLLSACAEAHPDFEVIESYPHDPQAYTQGLELQGRTLYESTGQHGRSSIRKQRLGEAGARRHDLPPEYFGEGLTLVGDSVVQLTWQEGTAFVYDTATLTPHRTVRYEGEGWGLCHDGTTLFMSDGSAELTLRDPHSFELTGRRTITLDGSPLQQINELECVGDFIFANVYMTNWIVQIDKRSGKVVAEFDLTSLTRDSGRPPNREAVLNGIAFDPSDGTFLVTGKLWPTLYRIRLAEVR
jgi:glutaminyl-peptide cyclotransferase